MRKLAKWGLTTLLFLWGMGSFLLLAGEPAEGMDIGCMLLTKLMAGISLLLCAATGMALHSAGLLVNFDDGEDGDGPLWG